jgi:hypothetical protein
MSTATLNPPVTPVRPTAMATQNGATDVHRKLKESSSQIDLKESRKLSEALAIREAPDKIEVPPTQPPPAIIDALATQVIPDQDEHDAEPGIIANDRAVSPHPLELFDWDDFRARYDQAMAEAKAKEDTLLNDFTELANASSLGTSYTLSY